MQPADGGPLGIGGQNRRVSVGRLQERLDDGVKNEIPRIHRHLVSPPLFARLGNQCERRYAAVIGRVTDDVSRQLSSVAITTRSRADERSHVTTVPWGVSSRRAVAEDRQDTVSQMTDAGGHVGLPPVWLTADL
jgi:hypothetical protein